MLDHESCADCVLDQAMSAPEFPSAPSSLGPDIGRSALIRWRRLWLGVAASVSLVVLLIGARPVQAGDEGVIRIESLSGWSDPAACSLRDGILAANRDEAVGACAAGSGDDEIVFNVTGTINLTATLPMIIESLSIDGSDPSAIVIQRVLTAPPFRLLEISSTTGSQLTVTVSGVHLSNGSAADSNGGAVLVNDHSRLVVTNVTFENNLAANGGAIFAEGPLAVSWSVFRNNTALVGGGAAFTADAVVICNSLFIDNAALGGTVISPSLGGGGALRLNAGPNRIDNNVFARNMAAVTAVGGAAIRISSPFFPTLIAHNTIVGGAVINPQSAIYVTGGGSTSAHITNTIITSHTIAIHRGGAISVTQDYNLFFGVVTPIVGTVAGGAHDRAGDPFFVNVPAGNYRLTANSPAVDRGIQIDVANDCDGNPRPLGWGPDIGAFEYTGNRIRRVSVPILFH